MAALTLPCGLREAWAEAKLPAQPRVSSIHPMTGTAGQTYQAVMRGRDLKGASRVAISGEGVLGRVLRVEPEPAPENGEKTAMDLVFVEIASAATATPGRHALRLITPNGITNEIAIAVSAEPVLGEQEVPNPISVLPVTITGRILERGETDTFWFDAAAGQKLNFQVRSGHNSFDPSIEVLEQAPSWFDTNHMERIAFNDEPLFFPGLSTDAQLVHTFARRGRYCVRVRSAAGQGGPDAVYELRIRPGDVSRASLDPARKENVWDERLFTRKLTPDWQALLMRRGAGSKPPGAIEIYRPVPAGSGEPKPVMRLPGAVEGTIASPAEAHRIKIKIEKAEDIAIEVETPDATMPRFNPVVLLFEPGGTEVATNVYTKRNNNGLYMMKMIQSKVTFSLHAPGEYEMEIRDITTDCSGKDFRYRVLVRPQIPHAGKIDIADDQLNLYQGSTREVNITLEREEGFGAVVAFAAEGLPEGVAVLPAAPKPIEKPPLPNGGKLDRYTPNSQQLALVFAAAAHARPSESPASIRIIARPLGNGGFGDSIVVKELPLMVLPARTK